MTRRAINTLPKMKPEGPVGFELRVNGRKRVRAVLPGEGVLVFNVALERALESESALKTVSIEGCDAYGLDTTGSRFMRWAKLHIAVGDRVEVRFVTGGKSSPRPRVLSVDNVSTRIGLAEQLRSLERQAAEVRRKMALSGAERRRRGALEWEKEVETQRRKIAAATSSLRGHKGRSP
jgi:hypothetical protein